MSRSESILRKRIRKFRRLKRGYYSFLIVAVAYAVSFFLPLLANGKALVVKYEGRVLLSGSFVLRRERFWAHSVRRSRLSRARRAVRSRRRRQLGADAARSVRSERRPARRFGLAAERAVVGASHGHRRSRARRARPPRVRLQYLDDVRAARHVARRRARHRDRRVARLLRRQARHARPARHRDLVVAAVSLHDHHRELRDRARVPPRHAAVAAAVVLAARRHPGGVRLDGHHVLRARRVLSREGQGLRRRGHRDRRLRRRHHLQPHPAERADAGRVLRAVHHRRQHRLARGARLPRFRAAGSDAQLGRAHRSGHGEPDQVVARLLSARRVVPDACCSSSSSARPCATRSIRKSTRACDDAHAITAPFAGCAPTSIPRPAWPRPSTASTSTCAPARCSGSSASRAPARASPR